MVVIVIIGILAVALLPRVIGAPSKARDVTRKTDLNNIIDALELYSTDVGYYPGTLSNSVNCLGGSDAVAAAIDDYLQEVPTDPSGLTSFTTCTTGGYYAYRPLPAQNGGTTATNYILVANLEGPATAVADDVYCTASSTTYLALSGNNYRSYATALSTLNGLTACGTSTYTNGYYVVLK